MTNETISEKPEQTEEEIQKKTDKLKLTPVSILHYIRLVYRSAMLLMLLVYYIISIIHGKEPITQKLEGSPVVILIVWIVFLVEMILRFFPSGLESPGCQKQFAGNYIKSGEVDIKIQDNNSVVLILLIWILFNMIFGALHMAGIFDDGIMLILCSVYSVCDVVCILFFCPFQSWFMKNKCCSVCRIYNWDYAMMFTPLFFVPQPYLRGLLVLSLILMIRWEVTFYRHPERFSEKTNEYLRCKNCTEKLCIHKNQLHRLWKQIEKYTAGRKKKLQKDT